MTERLVGGLPVEEVGALNKRIQERTAAFIRRGFWTRVWEAISGQHRGLVVFEENQADMFRMMGLMGLTVGRSGGVIQLSDQPDWEGAARGGTDPE